jgi:hypothetical protein
MWWEGRGWPVHRLTYNLLVRPLSEWEVADHLCCIRLCCNPAHIEPVSGAENARRGNRARRSETCGRGHLLTPDNTYTYQYAHRVFRQCKECVKVRQHTPEWRQRQRELSSKPERRARKADYWQAYAERRRVAASPTVERPSLF